MDSGLAGRVHFIARLHDIAHDGRLHFLRADSRAGDRGAYCRRSEIGRGNVFEAASKCPDRGANGLGKDH